MNNDLLPIRVLVIDDNCEECEIIKRTFELVKDIDVCGVANDGVSGIKMIVKLKPDIVLLDIIMPNVDGMEVAERIRQTNMSKIPKIIVLTAIGSQDVINTAFSFGVDYYLRKPVNLMSLIQKVRMVHKNIGCSDVYDRHKSKIKIIKETVRGIGVPINLTGYRYIVQVLEIMFKENMTFKQMYENMGNYNNTSGQCVEISIRNAIRKAAEIEVNFYISTFGEICSKVPSNSFFLETLKEIIYMKIPD